MIFPITFSCVYVKSLSVAIPREICANLDLDSIQYTSFMNSYNSGSRENSRSIKRGLFGTFWKKFSGSSKIAPQKMLPNARILNCFSQNPMGIPEAKNAGGETIGKSRVNKS